MKAIVVIDSISRAAGGLFDAERRLHQELFSAGVEIAVLGLTDEFAALDSESWNPIKPLVFPVCRPVSIGWSPQFQDALSHEQGDVLYRAGLWRLPSRAAHSWSRRQKKPEIIAPHGMLDPWAVQNSGWKKRVALAFYERKHLEHAACLRALCESEAQSIRAFGLKNPICIIPNGIDLPVLENAETLKAEKLKSGSTENVSACQNFSMSDLAASGRKILLYLGRLHPKKGLVNLLRAWAALQKTEAGRSKIEDWLLVIAGWDQGGHEAELKALATELGLWFEDWRLEIGDKSSEPRSGKDGEQGKTPATNLLSSRDAVPNLPSTKPPSVVFLGPQFGENKSSCYANCDAFILPSFSEGLPMVILEAWAYGKPVLMTPECNLPEGFAANAAIRIEQGEGSGEQGAKGIERGLLELLQSSISDLQSTGSRGRALVTARFTWPKIAAEMKSVYDWVLGSGEKPGCVRTN